MAAPPIFDVDMAEEEEKRIDSASASISVPSSSRRAPPCPKPGLYGLANGSGGPAAAASSCCLEIRLFYVRVSPCAADAVPPLLTLSHLRREMGVALEINGARVPASETTAIPLRRDRLDRDSAEVTFVSTDSVRLTGAVEFEVRDGQELILCGSLERMEPPWGNGTIHHHHQGSQLSSSSSDADPKTGWSMDCYSAASLASSAFVQPKLGITSPSIEVYVAGCWSGFPLILTHTVHHSPRRKVPRQRILDAIPEDDEREQSSGNGLLRQRMSSPVAEGETDEYDSEMKIGRSFYSEGGYYDDDGQLTWFNAGVRVGVGIGLGMCLGLGIGVGLLMRSYQATTRTFRRRFF